MKRSSTQTYILHCGHPCRCRPGLHGRRHDYNALLTLAFCDYSSLLRKKIHR